MLAHPAASRCTDGRSSQCAALPATRLTYSITVFIINSKQKTQQTQTDCVLSLCSSRALFTLHFDTVHTYYWITAAVINWLSQTLIDTLTDWFHLLYSNLTPRPFLSTQGPGLPGLAVSSLYGVIQLCSYHLMASLWGVEIIWRLLGCVHIVLSFALGVSLSRAFRDQSVSQVKLDQLDQR